MSNVQGIWFEEWASPLFTHSLLFYWFVEWNRLMHHHLIPHKLIISICMKNEFFFFWQSANFIISSKKLLKWNGSQSTDYSAIMIGHLLVWSALVQLKLGGVHSFSVLLKAWWARICTVFLRKNSGGVPHGVFKILYKKQEQKSREILTTGRRKESYWKVFGFSNWVTT